MKLWVRIALLNGLIVLILGGLIGVAMTSMVTTSMRTELIRQGNSISKNLSDRISNSVLLNDFYRTTEAVEDVQKTEPDVEYIFVTDKNGKLFAHTFKNGFPPDILSWNPLFAEVRSIKLLDTEKGLIRDIGIKIFEGMPFELHIGIKEERISKVLTKIRSIIAILTAMFVLIGLFSSSFVSRFITKPLYALVDFTRMLSRGEFGEKIAISSKDEVGKLTKTFNHLSQELKLYREKIEESYTQMLRTEKMTALGRLYAGFAHELRNPLTSIKVLFQTLEKNPGITKEDIKVILSEVNQMDSLLTKFLGFARKDSINFTEANVNTVIEQVISLIQYQAKNQSIVTLQNLAELPYIRCDRAMVEQAILNLVINAVDSMPDGGTLIISSSLQNGHMVIKVSDTGKGIPEENKDKIFDPFFTTKSDGTGLGLSIVHNIVEIHKGEIIFESSSLGTTFSLKLPVEK